MNFGAVLLVPCPSFGRVQHALLLTIAVHCTRLTLLNNAASSASQHMSICMQMSFEDSVMLACRTLFARSGAG